MSQPQWLDINPATGEEVGPEEQGAVRIYITDQQPFTLYPF